MRLSKPDRTEQMLNSCAKPGDEKELYHVRDGIVIVLELIIKYYKAVYSYEFQFQSFQALNKTFMQILPFVI